MIVAEKVHLSFRHVRALRGASVTAAAGKVVGVVGPNGAGKSTLLRVIAGLYTPDAGRVLLDGTPLTGGPVAAVHRGVVLAPQGRRLFNSMTVRENLNMGAYARGDKTSIRRDIARWTELYPEVKENLDQRAGVLSGGQQQIVAVVRALMADPKFLLLDEPSMGVAPMIVERIGRQIRQLAGEFGIGVVLVEQNVSLALQCSDEVVVMSHGCETYVGPPAALTDQEKLSQYFFDTVQHNGATATSS